MFSIHAIDFPISTLAPSSREDQRELNITAWIWVQESALFNLEMEQLAPQLQFINPILSSDTFCVHACRFYTI